MTGQDPKERRSCEGPAGTFRWLSWAINLVEQSSSLQLQRAVCLQEHTRIHKAARAGCETRILRPPWLRRCVAKKNSTPTASTTAKHGCRVGDRLQRSLCNPEGAAQQQQQPAVLKSLSCSREQGMRTAAVPGRDASTSTSPVWRHTVYLHKHAGLSILPFIRASLGLAHSPHWQLPLAALPAAVSRVESSFLSGCVLPWPGLVFSTHSLPSAPRIHQCCLPS